MRARRNILPPHSPPPLSLTASLPHPSLPSLLDLQAPATRLGAYRALAACAERSPLAAALLLDCGALSPGVLQELTRLRTGGDALLRRTVEATVLPSLVKALECLHHAAAKMLATPANSSDQAGAAPDSAGAQQQLAALGAALGQLGQPGRGAAQVLVRLQGQALPAARQLAAAVLTWRQQPDQAEAGQLEVAQAAAARSCSRLTCSNVELEGGPAAGEGLGCLRCGRCRVAYYCGTDCSHGDWKPDRKSVV